MQCIQILNLFEQKLYYKEKSQPLNSQIIPPDSKCKSNSKSRRQCAIETDLCCDNRKKASTSKPTYFPLLCLKEFKIETNEIITYRYIPFSQISDGNQSHTKDGSFY